MAELAALRTALQRIGFSDQASAAITDAQGMDSLDEFRVLTDDEVEDLCKVVRRPGGTIDNPNAAVAGQPARIPNPGIAVSMRATNNLKLMCYFLRYKERTSRDVTAADITTDSIRRLREYKTWEEQHEDPDAPELSFRDWPRTIEAIKEYLRDCLGSTKIPLAYVIRDDLAVPAGAGPPGGYGTNQDELIARAPIQMTNDAGDDVFTDIYLADRALVYEKIAALTRDHECWTYVRPAQRQRDGRMAFTGLDGHYLGINNIDNMAAKAEGKLQNTTYNGETRRWNFEKFVRLHVEQHHTIAGLVRHGHAGIDERSKVRHLLSGIKTKTLDHVKAQIYSSPTLRNDFDACVNLFQDFICQAPSNVHDINIAAVHSDKKRGGNPVSAEEYSNVKPDMSVEDRYYKREEYKSLSPAQKKGLSLKRKKRGGQGPKQSKKKQKTDLSVRDIKTLVTTQITKKLAEQEPDDSSSDEEVPLKDPADSTNRTNKALKRKGA